MPDFASQQTESGACRRSQSASNSQKRNEENVWFEASPGVLLCAFVSVIKLSMRITLIRENARKEVVSEYVQESQFYVGIVERNKGHQQICAKSSRSRQAENVQVGP
jgi:hypothetical protein